MSLTEEMQKLGQQDREQAKEIAHLNIDPITEGGKVVNPLGLYEYNCMYSHKAWDLRLRNPYEEESIEDNNKNCDLYDLKQKQRYYKRVIRKTRLQLVGKQVQIDNVAETDAKEISQKDHDKLVYKLTQQNGKYNDLNKVIYSCNMTR